jgi:hypothetical protein
MEKNAQREKRDAHRPRRQCRRCPGEVHPWQRHGTGEKNGGYATRLAAVVHHGTEMKGAYIYIYIGGVGRYRYIYYRVFRIFWFAQVLSFRIKIISEKSKIHT